MSEWPATLPQNLLIDGFSKSPANLMIRSQMDAGPAKVRRRFTAGVKPIQGEIKLTEAQLDTFKTFFNDTLIGGTLRFDWIDPDDGTTEVEMRFVEPPVWTREGDLFVVEMSLEIMP